MKTVRKREKGWNIREGKDVGVEEKTKRQAVMLVREEKRRDEKRRNRREKMKGRTRK